jgi:hypothetical protein
MSVPTNDAEAVSLELMQHARALYADPANPVVRILADTGLSKSTFYYILDGAGGRLPPIPRRTSSAGARRRAVSGDRVALVKRLWRTADRQVRDIEDRLVRHQQQPDERERDARMLAVLVKTLRELSTLDEDKGGDAKDTATDDEGPRDIDEFRRELARKMDAFIERKMGAGVSGASGE